MMKEIRWSQTFTRHYKQRIARDEQLTEAFWDSVETFVIDPVLSHYSNGLMTSHAQRPEEKRIEKRTDLFHNDLVDDHALTNVMQGKRSFSINDELRVVYIEHEDEFVFIDIGTHEQVYLSS